MAKDQIRVRIGGLLCGAALLLANGAVERCARASEAILKVSSARLVFGKSVFGVVGAASQPKTLSIRNRSNTESLTLGQLEVTGADAADFAIISNSCPVAPETLAGGGKCEVSVTFAPTALGPREAQLTVSDEGNDSTQTVALMGLGVQGKIVETPTHLNFGKVQAGSSSMTQSVILTNKEPVTLRITAVSASSGFVVKQSCVGNLAGNGGRCAISVTFAPQGKSYPKPIAVKGSLNISSDASSSPQAIALEGTAFGTAPPPPFSTTQTFVTNHCGWVTSYPAGAGGSPGPISPPTGLCFPRGIALDSMGATYVLNESDSVTIYPPGSSGNVAPAATIFGPNTGIHNPVGIAVDKSGAVYVLNCGTCAGGDNPFDSITIFAPGSSGNVSPIATIAGSNTGLMLSSVIALDGNGDIYVVLGLGQIFIFAAGSNGNIAPSSSMQGGCNAGICGPSGIALDGNGNIYITSTTYDSTGSSVAVFSAGSNGLVTPIAIISGANTNLISSTAIAVDAHGDIWVYNAGSQTGAGYITSYPAGSNGNVAPRATIGGPNTGLTQVYGLGLDGDDNLYVANYLGGSNQDGSVAIFASTSMGNVAPTAAIASNNQLNGAAGVAVDADGNIYIANSFGSSNAPGSVTIYSAASAADAAPSAVLSGPDTGLNVPYGIAIGASGKIYVSNLGNNSITVYPSGSFGDQAPIETIVGFNTALDAPYGVALDRNENIYVVNCSDCANAPFLDAITSYAAGSNGNVTPTANFQCVGGDPTCGLNFPTAIAVDSSGKIYVANDGSLAGVFGQGDTITVHQVGLDGQVSTPVATISGSDTQLAIPAGVALDANSNIYVSNATGGQFGLGSVTVYPAGSNGNASPGAMISGLDTALVEPIGIAALP